MVACFGKRIIVHIPCALSSLAPSFFTVFSFHTGFRLLFLSCSHVSVNITNKDKATTHTIIMEAPGKKVPGIAISSKFPCLKTSLMMIAIYNSSELCNSKLREYLSEQFKPENHAELLEGGRPVTFESIIVRFSWRYFY